MQNTERNIREQIYPLSVYMHGNKYRHLDYISSKGRVVFYDIRLKISPDNVSYKF